MHQRDRFRQLSMSLCLAVLVIGSRQSLAQRGPVFVSVAPVVERELAAGQVYVGTIMPLKTSSVGSAVDGRVADFPVNEGDFVRKGEPLAQLLTETITQELLASEAELNFRRYELAELENGSRPEEIAESKAKMLMSKAEVDYQEARKKRIDDLFKRNAANEDERQQVLSQAAAAVQMLAAAEEVLKLTESGPRVEKIAQARARVAIQEAVVQNFKDRVRKHTMIAPFDGFVVAEHTEVGQWIRSGELVAEVVALGEVDLQINVLEAHIPFVHVGLEASVEIPSLPGELFTGRVALVVPKADYRTRTFPVKVRIPNRITDAGPALKIPTIKAGMLARTTLPTGPQQMTMLVSKDALVLGGRQATVFVVDPSAENKETGTVRTVPVQTGVSTGRLIEVKGSLKPGELIIIRGNERVRPGAEVTIGERLEPDAAPRAQAVGSDAPAAQ